MMMMIMMKCWTLRVRLPAVHCQVSTWIGDGLLEGKPSWYVTYTNLPSIPKRQENRVQACLAEVSAG